MSETAGVAAVVLAAGRSRRMGRPKMNLPWGERTVIGEVVHTLLEAGIKNAVVVTGGGREEVEAALLGTGVRLAFNPNYGEDDMLVSFQTGLAALASERELAVGEAVKAALVVLGDQPQIEAGVIRRLVERFQESGEGIIVPSYQRRRGHPWLLGKRFWDEVKGMGGGSSLRTFLDRHAEEIDYLNVDSPSVLLDLDTPQDYENHKPDISPE